MSFIAIGTIPIVEPDVIRHNSEVFKLYSMVMSSDDLLETGQVITSMLENTILYKLLNGLILPTFYKLLNLIFLGKLSKHIKRLSLIEIWHDV